MSQAWRLSRESFLDELEVVAMLRQIRARSAESTTVFVDRFIVETLLFTGLKSTEFCQLTLSDVMRLAKDLKLQIRRGASAVRSIHVPSFIVPLIETYLREVRPVFASTRQRGLVESEPLALNRRGRPFDRSTLYRRVFRVLADCDLGAKASAQLLRHTYGYLMYKRSGGNLLFVQRQMGHSHPMITSVYEQFAPMAESQVVQGAMSDFAPTHDEQQVEGRKSTRRPRSR